MPAAMPESSGRLALQRAQEHCDHLRFFGFLQAASVASAGPQKKPSLPEQIPAVYNGLHVIASVSTLCTHAHLCSHVWVE